MWKWRTKKERVYAERKPTQKLEECPAIASRKKLSALSLKNRQNILLEIQEAQDLQEWKDRMDSTLECLATNKDIMLAKTYLAEKEKFKTKKENQLKRIKKILRLWAIFIRYTNWGI